MGLLWTFPAQIADSVVQQALSCTIELPFDEEVKIPKGFAKFKNHVIAERLVSPCSRPWWTNEFEAFREALERRISTWIRSRDIPASQQDRFRAQRLVMFSMALIRTGRSRDGKFVDPETKGESGYALGKTMICTLFGLDP